MLRQPMSGFSGNRTGSRVPGIAPLGVPPAKPPPGGPGASGERISNGTRADCLQPVDFCQLTYCYS